MSAKTMAQPRAGPSFLGWAVGGDPVAVSQALERAWVFALRVGLGAAALSLAATLWSASTSQDEPAASAVMLLLWHVLSVTYAVFR